MTKPSENEKSKRMIGVWLTADEYERVRQLAFQERVSLSAYARSALISRAKRAKVAK